MKLFHLSDLHIGKRLHEYSLLDDQSYILNEVLRIADEEQPDGIILAGDIYDKTVPSAEAVRVLDRFLSELSKRKIPVYLISGNHDSAERIAFGAQLMENSGIHISPVYDGTIPVITQKDEYGSWHLYLLPFLKPSHIRPFFPDEVIDSYTDAMRVVIDHLDIEKTERNILVTHQFVTGATRSDSEEVSVGGTDNVDASVFAPFDYTALGHIHGPQNIKSEAIRYCGTPLKYSFSEANHIKSITVLSIREKGNLQIKTVPLIPKRDLRILRGSYQELCLRDNYIHTNTDDYVQIILTDEQEVLNANANLKVIYPNLMNLLYDNTRTRSQNKPELTGEIQSKQPLDLFAELYEQQNGAPLTESQTQLLQNLLDEIKQEVDE